MKEESSDEKNGFEKDMEDLQDWLDNRYNPGHYIGTGRVPRPISRLTKYPFLLIILGLLCIVPTIIALISSKFAWHSLISSIIPLIISISFVIRGVQRHLHMKGYKKSKTNNKV